MPKLLRIVISGVLLALVIAFADWRAIWAVLRDVELVWVGAAFALALLDRVVLNYRWQLLLTARGVVPGFWRLFRVQLAANFLGSFMPSSIGVDAVRIAALCRSGEPAAPVVAATLVDRISIAVATLLLGSATIVALAGARVPPHISQFVYVMTAVGLLACVLLLHPSVRGWVKEMVLPRVPERFRRIVADVGTASLAYRRDARLLLVVAAVTVVMFAVRISFAKAIAYACGVDIGFLDLLLVIPVLWIVVMLPITIGGLGVQDAGYVVLMGLIGVAAPVAVSMSLIEHVVARAASLPGALFLGDVMLRGNRPAAVADGDPPALNR